MPIESLVMQIYSALNYRPCVMKRTHNIFCPVLPAYIPRAGAPARREDSRSESRCLTGEERNSVEAHIFWWLYFGVPRKPGVAPPPEIFPVLFPTKRLRTLSAGLRIVSHRGREGLRTRSNPLDGTGPNPRTNTGIAGCLRVPRAV